MLLQLIIQVQSQFQCQLYQVLAVQCVSEQLIITLSVALKLAQATWVTTAKLKITKLIFFSLLHVQVLLQHLLLLALLTRFVTTRFQILQLQTRIQIMEFTTNGTRVLHLVLDHGTAVPGATLSTMSTPNMTTTSYFMAVITCTNGMGTTTTSAGQVTVCNNRCKQYSIP